jgi:hypothetical protein
MKIVALVAFAIAFAGISESAIAGSNMAAIAKLTTAKCKEKVTPKHLRGDAYKQAMMDCKADPDAYK